MNTSFYLALDRLPMSLVAAMEFVGTIGVALYGLRTARNFTALALAVLGVFLLIDVKWSTDPLGLFWAFLNGALFVGYIVLGHEISQGGASGGVERLGAAMAMAFFFIMPIGFVQAAEAFTVPVLVLAGVAVIPYVCDQLAMSRLPRASFALMLALLPAMATLIGVMVLAQIPSRQDMIVLLVTSGVAIHKPTAPEAPIQEVARRREILVADRLHKRVANDGAGSGSQRPLPRVLHWRATVDEHGHYCFAVPL
jgi:inner membrane transporter RhtA